MNRAASTARYALATLAVAFALLAGARIGSIPWPDDPAMRGPMMGRLGHYPPIPPGLLAAAMAATLAVALRQWWPRASYVAATVALAAYLAQGGTVPGAAVAAAVAVIGLACRYGTSAWRWLLLLIPMLGARFLAPGHPVDALELGRLGSTLLWILVPAAIWTARSAHRARLRRERDEELHRATTDERLRMARDVHDIVGHSLSVISLQSGVALRVLDADPAQARASLEAIRASARESLADLRSALGVFRADPDAAFLAPTPALDALPALVGRVRAGGPDVTLTVSDAAAAAPRGVQTAAYRIVQESLTNAVRHAPGASVAVAVAADGGVLTVDVRDDGGPASLVEGGGIRGMRERAASVGGMLDVSSTPAGTVVSARLPLSAPDPHAPQEDPS